MARGVTQQEITGAADALLAAGERPTVERVRLALGRGSPNTIGPLLESWWTSLAQRITARLTLPAVPDEVGAAFAQVWESALTAGQAHAEAQVAPERAALAEVLAQSEAAVAAERERASALEWRLRQAEAATATQYNEWLVSDQQVGHLGRQMATLEAQVQELTVRRDALEARWLDAQRQAETVRAAAAAERDALQAHLRQVENRAHADIDRLRQDAKRLTAEAAAQSKAHAATMKQAQQAASSAGAALHHAQREAAAQAARAKALEGQLARLTAQTKAKPAATARRKSAVAPRKRAPQ